MKSRRNKRLSNMKRLARLLSQRKRPVNLQLLRSVRDKRQLLSRRLASRQSKKRRLVNSPS